MKEFYQGKEILITGGAGYVGQLLTEKLLEFEPEAIRILDIHENGLFNLRKKYSGAAATRLRFLLGDIRDLNRLRYAFDSVDIVFHTASYKHVVECEYNPIDAVETNIRGTSNVIQAALDCRVDKVIFTSSDKAANPSNTMGTTKLLAEKLVIAANEYRGTRRTVFACCRFGNVLRSSGSVIPLWEEQILGGRSITVTDREMTRFLISKEKAVELLLWAGYVARGGEVFIFKMPAIRIGDLAEAIMEKYGQVPVETIGRKAGEKLYEELMTEEEMARAYEGDDMYVISPSIRTLDPGAYEGFAKATSVKTSRESVPLTHEEILRLIE